MRVDALHRRIANDVSVMYDAVTSVFPVQMPQQYETQAMNLRPFIRRLNAVSHPVNIHHQIKHDKELGVGDIVLSGLWYPQSLLPKYGSEADVRVLWNVHPDTKRIHWSKKQWKRRRFYFWTLTMHELIHRHQPSSAEDRNARTYRPIAGDDTALAEEQKYYGNADEIETHAHEAAVEMFAWYPGLSFRQSIEAMKNVKAATPPSYMLVLQAFQNCPDHPALRHFKRKVRSWFDVVYKNEDFYRSLQLPKIA